MKNFLILALMIIIAACTSTPVKKPEVVVPVPEQLPGHKALFKTTSSLTGIKNSVDVANCVINLKDFQDEVRSTERFDYTNDNGQTVLNKLLSLEKVIVSTYVTSWMAPWKCDVLGYHTTGNTVFINTRGCVYPRKTESLVNTNVHEALHIARYEHGGNESQGKENSVNYKIGRIAQKHAPKCMEVHNE